MNFPLVTLPQPTKEHFTEFTLDIYQILPLPVIPPPSSLGSEGYNLISQGNKQDINVLGDTLEESSQNQAASGSSPRNSPYRASHHRKTCTVQPIPKR